jgi:hypothetical protein
MPSTKRKIELEITQREIESLTEMLYPGIIKKPSPNAEEIAKIILHKISEIYYQNRQSKLKLPKLDEIEINEDIENDDDFDEISNMSFSLRLFDLLNIIEDNDFTPNIELKVKDPNLKDRVKTIFNAQQIICIVPNTKGREKLIYQFELDNGIRVIKSYLINDDLMTFENLIGKLDSLNRYLLQISKNSIVNIKYYNLLDKENVIIQLENITDKKIIKLKLTLVKDEKGLTGFDKFLYLKQYFQKRLLYQKRVIGYIEEMK